MSGVIHDVQRYTDPVGNKVLGSKIDVAHDVLDAKKGAAPPGYNPKGVIGGNTPEPANPYLVGALKAPPAGGIGGVPGGPAGNPSSSPSLNPGQGSPSGYTPNFWEANPSASGHAGGAAPPSQPLTATARPMTGAMPPGGIMGGPPPGAQPPPAGVTAPGQGPPGAGPITTPGQAAQPAPGTPPPQVTTPMVGGPRFNPALVGALRG